MGFQQRDYILRMIEQLADAIARIAGARAAGRLDEAALLVRETADGILGPLRGMLENLDSAGAAALLGDRTKLLAYAALTAEQAANDDASGRRPAYRRALELYLEAVRLDPQVDERTRGAIVALVSRVDERRLGERYRKALEAL